MIVAVKLLKNFNTKLILAFSLPYIILATAFHFYRNNIYNFFVTPYGYPKGMLIDFLVRIPTDIFYSIQGNYYLTEIGNIYFFNAVYAVIFTIIALSLPIFGIYFLVKKSETLFAVSALTMLPIMLATLFTFFMIPRYVLPISGFMLLAIFLLLKDIQIFNFKLYSSFYMLFLMGTISLITFYNYSFSHYNDSKLTSVIDRLKDNGAGYVFCQESLLSWQINFYSNEEVIARDAIMPGRYPPYFNAVNSAYNTGKKTAILSSTYMFYGLKMEKDEYVDGFLFSYDPPQSELSKNFQF